MRASTLEKLRAQKRAAFKTTNINDVDGLLELMLGGKLNPTQRAFIYDTSRMTAYMGPEGCAKTSTICAKQFLRALTQPNSHHLVARQDFNDLLGTTMQRMQEMLNRLPNGILIDRDKQPPVRWWLRPIVGDEPSEIMFMGLKDGLGSYAWDTAIVDEAVEVDESQILGIDGRLRGEASLSHNMYSLSLAFNPPARSHWMYTACTGYDAEQRYIREPYLKLYRPSPNENAAHLPKDYYERRLASYNDDMRQRLVLGEWGTTFEGEAVYREFSRPLHVRDLKYSKYLRMFRFWDFGYNRPCCIWAQLDMDGRLLALKCLLGEKEEIIPFANKCKAITSELYPEANDIVDYGDPAVRQHKDTGSTLNELNKCGIVMLYQISKVDDGLRAVRFQLERMIKGEPALQFDRQGCVQLIDALGGGYRKGKDGIKPLKDGYYEHPADAYRYGVYNIFGGGLQIPIVPSSNTLPSSLAYNASQDEDLRRQQVLTIHDYVNLFHN